MVSTCLNEQFGYFVVRATLWREAPFSEQEHCRSIICQNGAIWAQYVRNKNTYLLVFQNGAFGTE